MIDELNKRIIEVMVRTEHSKSTFAKALDVSLPLITHITTGRNKPGLDIMQKLLTHFEDINPDWLLLGTGSMHREKKQAADYSSIIAQLNQLQTTINGIKQSQQSVIQYHKILLDEVLHLSEMNKLIESSEFQMEAINAKIGQLKQDLLSL